MNDALKTQISAFVDGELPASEAEMLTRRLSKDAELRGQAGAYLAIGRLMRGEHSVAGSAGLRERIALALESEDQLAAVDTAGQASRWQRPAAGIAIAASVAVLALVGLRQLDVGDDALIPAAGVTASNGETAYTEPAATAVETDRPSDVLMQYYLSHGATSGDLGANGVLSRLVTLELRGGELVEVAPQPETLESGAVDDDNDGDPAVQE